MRSGLEEQVAKLLDELKIDYTYETDKVKYVIESNYIPDFKVGNIYLETKGYFKAADRRKMLAVKKGNPDLDIRLVFQAPHNKISKKSKTTYAMWATKHGFPWCPHYAIPIDWLRV
tara:strand:+ start:2236 stop:2583 length:348 start_codon:yes stop_codon:yes gene_type:complete